MTDDNKYHGHMTMPDGSHVALTAEEAKALWEEVERGKEERAKAMPTAKDALAAICDAQQRLNELGWRQNGGLRVKRGDNCAVAESGSTGMWKGWLDDDGKYVNYAGCVSNPRYTWLKPLNELTEEETAWIAKCAEQDTGFW